jgi:hypothetical protein
LGALFDDTGPVFDRGEVRSAVLRRDREVFEGEEPFDPKIGDGQLLHGIEDEVHDMTGRYPFDSAQGPDHCSRLYAMASSLFRGAVLNLARISCDHRQQM